eukprot:2363407-Amphidinium_carterae.1
MIQNIILGLWGLNGSGGLCTTGFGRVGCHSWNQTPTRPTIKHSTQHVLPVCASTFSTKVKCQEKINPGLYDYNQDSLKDAKHRTKK